MSRLFLAWLTGFIAFTTGISAAVKPPNDNFVNRIVLQGNKVAFSGTLAGASYEPGEVYGNAQTVWWSWTATETGPVAIEFWNIRRAAPFSNSDYTYLTVYNPTNLALGFPTNDYPVKTVARMVFLPDNVHPTLIFTGYVGQTYQIQLGANTSADHEMSLTATNNPIILQHPQTTSAAEHESVLFTVAAVGVMPLNYQWFSGGTLLNGSNGPTLMLKDVSAANAGDYSVIISNSTGTTTSLVAHLFVNATALPPTLDFPKQDGSNGFRLSLTGEPGRYYRIETTTDFVQWQRETNFVSRHVFDWRPRTNSFAYSSNGSATFSLPAGNAQKFVRSVRYAPSNEVCNVNLKQLRFLKKVWAMQTIRVSWETPQDMDLFTPLNIPKPLCPSGGFYSLGAVETDVQCSVPGHKLEEPQ
jgi:hypothetical protein